MTHQNGSDTACAYVYDNSGTVFSITRGNSGAAEKNFADSAKRS